MKPNFFISLAILCSQSVHAFNLPEQKIKSYECQTCNTLSHESLQANWPIHHAPLDERISNKQKSFSYTLNATGAQLEKGIRVDTLAPGAVLRITPLNKKPTPALQLISPSRKLMNLTEASSSYSNEDILSNGQKLEKNPNIFQIKPALGSGAFTLKSPVDLNNSDNYLMRVFDKFSPISSAVETNKTHYLYNDTLKANIWLEGADDDDEVTDVHASIIGPHGETIPLKITQVSTNQFEATTVLHSEYNVLGENWHIETYIEFDHSGMSIRRNNHTAFSYAIPSASMTTLKKIKSSPLTLEAEMDVATPSRYALQSVLFYKDDAGTLKPIETSQTGQWLNLGKNIIQFTFDNPDHLSDDKLYIGYLHVIDYGQLKPVYQFNQPILLRQLVE